MPKVHIFNPSCLSSYLHRDIKGTVDREALEDSNIEKFYSLLNEYQTQKHGVILSSGYRRKRWYWVEPHWMAIARDEQGESWNVS